MPFRNAGVSPALLTFGAIKPNVDADESHIARALDLARAAQPSLTPILASAASSSKITASSAKASTTTTSSTTPKSSP